MDEIRALVSKIQKQMPELTLRFDEPLAQYTSFRIGGPAEVIALPRSVEALRALLACAAEHHVKPMILGAGTNVLVQDAGVRGLVIVLRDALCGCAQLNETTIAAYAGTTMAKLAMFAKDCGLSGLEFAHGIPGTVGGGVYMNAGAYGGEICQVATETEFLHADGTLQTYAGDEQGFSYRMSRFQRMDGVIVRTVFSLAPAEKSEIRAKMQELAERRRNAQPLEYPSAGSTFKRPKQGYAAALIDQAGLKGKGVGGAAVSEKHAGFIINRGGATCADVLATMELVRETVFRQTGIELEAEVKLL